MKSLLLRRDSEQERQQNADSIHVVSNCDRLGAS